MNKIKEKLFSLPKVKLIPIVVAGVLIAGVAGAALVDYLSNTILTQTEIKTPIVLGDTEWQFSTKPSEHYAGDPMLGLVEITNQSQGYIKGNVELNVKQWKSGEWQPFDGKGIYVAVSDDIGFAWDPEYNSGVLGWKDWLKNNADWFDWTISEGDGTNCGDLSKYNVCELVESLGGSCSGDGTLGNWYNAGDLDGDRDERLTPRVLYAQYSCALPVKTKEGTVVTIPEVYARQGFIPFVNGKMVIPMFGIEWDGVMGEAPPAYDELAPGEVVKLVYWVKTDPALEPGDYLFSVTVTP